MEEERARQEAAAKRSAEEAARQEKGEELSSKSEDATMTEHVNASSLNEDKKLSDDMVGVSSYRDVCLCLHVAFCSS